MAYKPPPYPTELTNKNWQSVKGIIAKFAGETGIGDLLKKLEAAYEAVDWRALQLVFNTPQGKGRTQQTIDAAYADAAKQGAKLKALSKACREVEKAAKDLAAKWSKDKKIPAGSVKKVNEIEHAVFTLSFAVAEGTVSDALRTEKKELEEQLLILSAEYRKMNEKLKKYLDGFESAVKGKKLGDYASIWGEHIRGVGTVLPTLIKDHPEMDTEWKIWKNFSNKLAEPESEEEMQKRMAMLVKVANSLKPKVAKLN